MPTIAINNDSATTGLITDLRTYGSATFESPYVEWSLKRTEEDAKRGIRPQLYFQFVKSKLGLLERVALNQKIKVIEKAFNKAVENGQNALAEEFLKKIELATKESIAYAKGVTRFVDGEVVNRHKHNIRDGHISDTVYEKYTRIIPEDIVAKKKKLEDVFDSFIIYHYYDPKAKDLKSLPPEKKSAMRDPILFGKLNGSSRLYFIAEWDDEYCDLSFDEITDFLGHDEPTNLGKNIQGLE